MTWIKCVVERAVCVGHGKRYLGGDGDEGGVDDSGKRNNPAMASRQNKQSSSLFPETLPQDTASFFFRYRCGYAATLDVTKAAMNGKGHGDSGSSARRRLHKWG